jgi:transposase InsO family protein
METDVHEQRVKFCHEYESGGWTMADLSAEFGVSRKTGYKWLRRLQEGGLDALKDQPRTPESQPNRTPQGIRRAIVVMRRKHPTWGSKKILAWLLRRQPEEAWPARSTIDTILSGEGLVKRRRPRRRASPTPLGSMTQPEGPNDVWCVDYKGHFSLGNGDRCEPLTINDLYSRYSLVCQALTTPRLEDTQKSFEIAFREYGLPCVIRSDNGPPFASVGLAGLSRLNIWWMKLGIRPERIQPGKPQQNGGQERFHRTLKQETASPPKQTRGAQQGAFTRFRGTYNHERPHEALGQRPPAELYEASPRSYPDRPPDDFDYRSGMEVRRVGKNGGIKFRQLKVFISETLDGENVGLEMVGDGLWTVHAGPLELGVLNERTAKLLRNSQTRP